MPLNVYFARLLFQAGSAILRLIRFCLVLLAVYALLVVGFAL